MIKRLSQCIRF